jgi:hypothetical protein
VGGDSERLADDAVDRWRHIEGVLSPIIGRHGMGALFRRTVFLARRGHPWLVVPAGSDTIDFEQLRAMLSGNPSKAAHASADLFKTFTELLSSLIGAPLVARLLPVQETKHD